MSASGNSLKIGILDLGRNEVSMNMAKLAFASSVRVKDAAGVDRIPFMKERANEALIAAAKDYYDTYTHFFRLPTRLCRMSSGGYPTSKYKKRK